MVSDHGGPVFRGSTVTLCVRTLPVEVARPLLLRAIAAAKEKNDRIYANSGCVLLRASNSLSFPISRVERR